MVAFAARRFNRRVGVLVTERVDAESGSASWLQLAKPDAVDRIRVGPLSLGGLHTLISTRLGQYLSRPTMMRIAEVSGGNPFYALELARAIDAVSTSADSVLPATLAELMRIRIGRLDQQAQDVLLAAACVANPTVELLAMATNNTVDRIVELLDEPESNRVVGIEGQQSAIRPPTARPKCFHRGEPWSAPSDPSVAGQRPCPTRAESQTHGAGHRKRRPGNAAGSRYRRCGRARRGAPAPPRSWLSWRSDSAGISHHAESARPNTTSKPVTRTELARCWNRRSITCIPDCFGASH